MSWGYRCDLGCESWPDSADYKICPVCDQEATRFSNLKPLDPTEARSLVNGLKFEAYYEQRCAERAVTADGPIKKLGSNDVLPFVWPEAEPS